MLSLVKFADHYKYSVKSPMRVTVALPDSMVFDEWHLRDKTERLGQIARALAIFRVNEVIIYHSPFLDPAEAEIERRIIGTILGYMECPQYLRRTLFPLHKDLEFAGLLPPLATAHHMVDDRPKPSQFREALVYLDQKKQVLAKAGLKSPLRVLNPPPESLKEKRIRMTIQVVQGTNSDLFDCQVVPREEVEAKVYWGFRIKFTGGALGKFGAHRKEYCIIATDKTGAGYNELGPDVVKQLQREIAKTGILMLFGEPRHDLYEMMKGTADIKLKDISDLILNTVPNSGTRSIRLEEALIISLARLLPVFAPER